MDFVIVFAVIATLYCGIGWMLKDIVKYFRRK